MFHISPKSFYQINPVQTEALYNKAIEMAGLKGNETVLDSYCGIGTISLIVRINNQCRTLVLEKYSDIILTIGSEIAVDWRV